MIQFIENRQVIIMIAIIYILGNVMFPKKIVYDNLLANYDEL